MSIHEEPVLASPPPYRHVLLGEVGGYRIVRQHLSESGQWEAENTLPNLFLPGHAEEVAEYLDRNRGRSDGLVILRPSMPKDAAFKPPVTMHARIRRVVSATATFFRVTLDLLMSRARDHGTTRKRHVAVLVLRRRGFTLSEIGDFFKRDHATVLNSLSRAHIDESIQTDADLVEGILRREEAT